MRKTRLPLFLSSTIVEEPKFEFKIVAYETASGKIPINKWLDTLDNSVRSKVELRIDRLAQGHFGHSKALKNGLWELKFKNPAIRIYYSVIKTKIVLIILGGDKRFQTKDIRRAYEYLEDYRMRYENEEESS